MIETVAASAPAPRTSAPLSNDALLDRAIAQLDATSSAHDLAQLLRDRRDDIVVLEHEGGPLPAGAGGRWDAATQRLYILRADLEHPAGATLLAHEAVHMRDGGSRLRQFGNALGGVGHGLLGMAVAPFKLDNPISAAIDGVRGGFQIPAEVDAYHLQAQVFQELGMRSDWLQQDDGTPRSRAELADHLLDDALYQVPPFVRGALGAGFAWIGGRATGQLVNTAVGRLAPTSWVGRHPVAVTAVALAGWAGLVVQDHVATRAR